MQAIPPTLQQSLAARLDRLGSAREIAQIGAVLGRGFSHALLQAVAGLDEPALRAALDRLADAELLFVEGVAPHANYRFKHALIQDAAYDSLLKSRRQTLHRRAAEVLLASPAPEAEALAHHFTQAGQTELAIEWWGKAGDQALRRSAFAEAISHLGKAIELSDKAGGAARPREAAATASASQRLKLQTNYGQAVMWAKGFAAEETKAAFARVGELATEIGDAEAPLDAYFARWAHSLFRGELGSARETAESFLREAEREARPTEAAAAHRLLGLTLLFQGDFAQARAHFEQTLRIYDPERDREAKFRLGLDSKVAATSYLALAAWCFGDVGRARELMDEAVARAVESAHAPTLANTYFLQALLEILRDDAEAARRAAEAVVALSREHGLALYLALGALPSAWARAKLGDRDAGSAEFRQALAEYASQGNKFFCRSIEGCSRKSKPSGEARKPPWPGSTKRWRWRARPESIGSTPDSIASAAKSSSNKTPPTPPPPKPPSSPPSPSRNSKRPAASSCAPRCRWPSSTSPRAARSTPTTFSAPALEGFSPTPEFPQIAEAKALFEALAADETVKADAARRAQRLKLQTNYGQAVMWSKGFAAEETKAAFARVGELATEIGDAEALFDAYYGSLGRKSVSRRAWVGPGDGRELPARSGTRGAADGGGGRASPSGIDSPLPRRFRGGAGAFRTGAANLRSRARPRSQVPLRSGLRRRGDGLSGSRGLAPRRRRTRTGARSDEAVARAVESAHAPTLANTYYHPGHARNPP